MGVSRRVGIWKKGSQMNWLPSSFSLKPETGVSSSCLHSKWNQSVLIQWPEVECFVFADLVGIPISPVEALSAAITLREVAVYISPFLSVATSGVPIHAWCLHRYILTRRAKPFEHYSAWRRFHLPVKYTRLILKNCVCNLDTACKQSANQQPDRYPARLSVHDDPLRLAYALWQWAFEPALLSEYELSRLTQTLPLGTFRIL